jgi:hypothetical protein
MANTYTLISSVTLASSQSTMTFSSIPSTYTDLKLVVSARLDAVDTDNLISFNGSTTSLTSKRLVGIGSGTPSSDSPTRYAGQVDASSYTASTFSNTEIYIPNYAGSTNKSYSVDTVVENNATGAPMALAAGLWSNTAAITSITLTANTGNYVQYTTAYLYGVKNA